MSYARHSRRRHKRHLKNGKTIWVRQSTARHRRGAGATLSALGAAAGTGMSSLVLGLSTVTVMALATTAYVTASLIFASRQSTKTQRGAGASRGRGGMAGRLWNRYRDRRTLAREMTATRSCERCGMGATTVLNGEPLCASCRKTVLVLSGTVVDSRQWRRQRRDQRAGENRVLRTRERERRARSEAAVSAEQAKRRAQAAHERAAFKAEAKVAESRLREQLKGNRRRETGAGA